MDLGEDFAAEAEGEEEEGDDADEDEGESEGESGGEDDPDQGALAPAKPVRFIDEIDGTPVFRSAIAAVPVSRYKKRRK
jgi:hypothetical protein